jgi:hypothetical protein
VLETSLEKELEYNPILAEINGPKIRKRDYLKLNFYFLNASLL